MSHQISTSGGRSGVDPPLSAVLEQPVGYNRVSPEHVEFLNTRGISPDVANARGYWTAATTASLGRLEPAPPAGARIVPGVVIPVYSVHGHVAFCLYRPDDPRICKGKVAKYEMPSGVRMALDAHPFIRRHLGDPSVPLVITEGVPKADAAISAGMCCLALLGVWNWRGTNRSGGKTALADRELVALNDRQVLVAFDSDIVTKPQVKKAIVRLGGLLRSRGADVRYAYLPSGPFGEKQGLDDWLVSSGGDDDDLLQLTRDTPEPGSPKPNRGQLPGHAKRLIAPPNEPTAVARHFLESDEWHQAPLLVWWRGGGYLWGGRCWSEIPEAAIRAELYRYLDDSCYERENPHTGAIELVPWRPNMARVNHVLDALKAAVHLDYDREERTWIGLEEIADTDGHACVPIATRVRAGSGELPTAVSEGVWIPVTDGLLNLLTREMIPHTSQYFVHYVIRIDVASALETHACPRVSRDRQGGTLFDDWIGFVKDLWEDSPASIDLLQQWFGYVLSGETRLQKMLLLVGPPRSGKGTVARILTALLGMRNACFPTLSSLAGMFGLQPLLNKQLAVMGDIRFGGRDGDVVVERLLNITGEDSLTVRRKHREAWDGKLGVRIMGMSNEVPRLTEVSGALASRFVIPAPLIKSYLGREDLGLEDKLMKALPDILLWAMDGYDRLREQGHFTVPRESDDIRREMEFVSSPIREFLEERCEIHPMQEVEIDALYAAWRAWCMENGRDHPGTKQEFGRKLRAAVPAMDAAQRGSARTGDSRRRIYQGIGLKSWLGRGAQLGHEMRYTNIRGP